ncbi:MAG TPA: S24 family peptidase [Bacteroidota bacterium]|nr:S24 family peptidase [Bacteroidota bacterium]
MKEKQTNKFLMRVHGNSMIGADIEDGDYVLVEKSFNNLHNSIVIASINDNWTLKQINLNQNNITLIPANPDYDEIHVLPTDKFRIIGKVQKVIHPI